MKHRQREIVKNLLKRDKGKKDKQKRKKGKKERKKERDKTEYIKMKKSIMDPLKKISSNGPGRSCAK